MEQLSGLDAAFLAMESETVQGHGGGVCLLEGPPAYPALTLEALTTTVQQRLHLVPLFRRKLHQVPFGLDQPYWVDDPQLDLRHHVRETSLPEDAGAQDLADVVAGLHSARLDRDRPLWELHLIHGLPEGNQAVYLKVHHAAIDGVSGNDLLTALLDQTPEAGVIPDLVPATAAPPSTVRLVTRTAGTFASHPRRAVSLTVSVARSLPAVLGRVVGRHLPASPSQSEPDTVDLDGGRGVRAPDTPFNHAITAQRALHLRAVAFSDVHDVKTALGTTVNDVLMAMCAGALRRWLEELDALPDKPLVAAVPVSTRTPEDEGSAGNRLTMMFASLPTDEPDLMTRARRAHESMRGAKEFHGALPANLLAEVTQFAMPSLAGLAIRLSARLRVLERVKPFNLIISNVPGPKGPLYLAGTRLLAYYPVSQVVDGQGLNITVLSYGGQINIGVLGDPTLAPHLDHLADYLTDELRLLVAQVKGLPVRTGAVRRTRGSRGAASTQRREGKNVH